MGKASSAKKVARAARAGGNRRAGQRRALGFPVMIAAVLLLGVALVVFARDERNRNAAPRVNTGAAGVTGDHWHEPYSIYTCVVDTAPGAASSSDSSSSDSSSSDASTKTVPTTTVPTDTTPTTAATSTTIAAEGDVPGEYREFLKDATSQDPLGIHTHGDGTAHIHPFASGASGRRATLDKLFNQTGATMTDDTLSIPNPTTGSTDTFREGETKCQGGKDGVLKVARWDNAQDAASGKKPNEIISSNFGSIRLRNGQVLSITFLPEGSTLPVQSDVATRLGQLTDVATSSVESSSTPAEGTAPSSLDTTPSPASSESPASSSS